MLCTSHYGIQVILFKRSVQIWDYIGQQVCTHSLTDKNMTARKELEGNTDIQSPWDIKRPTTTLSTHLGDHLRLLEGKQGGLVGWDDIFLFSK